MLQLYFSAWLLKHKTLTGKNIVNILWSNLFPNNYNICHDSLCKTKWTCFWEPSVGFFKNNLAALLLTEPSRSHRPTSNQIGPVHLFVSYSSTPPPPHTPPYSVIHYVCMWIKYDSTSYCFKRNTNTKDSTRLLKVICFICTMNPNMLILKYKL